jgi:hypothetical protein
VFNFEGMEGVKSVIEDTSALVRPICFDCKHLKKGMICKAFPNGIPNNILLGKNNHRKPLRGQGNDVVFEKN